jgi:polyketide cyclase/dehydrase/lipid transport protein
VKILKLIIGSFISLLIIITIISLFIPSHVQISKAVEVNAAKDSIYQQIIDPAQWHHWYPANDSIKVLYTNDQPNGIEINSLKLQIARSNADTVWATYSSPVEKKHMQTSWSLIDAKSSVAVQWSMDFHLRWYPWEKFSSLLLEKRYGPVMETGLNNLKTYLEQNRSSKK